MKYKKKPFPCGFIINTLIFLSLFIYLLYQYIYGTAISNEDENFLIALIFLGLGVFVLFAVTIREIKNHYKILRFMQEDKYVLCTQFKSKIIVVRNRKKHSKRRYSRTEGLIEDGQGNTRKIESARYTIGCNPFEDGRTEIIVFIDIDDPRSPYYMYPYSDSKN